MSHARAAEPRRPLRAARGAVVGGVAAGLALAGHALGGGAPGPASYAAAALVLAAAVVASRSRWTAGRLLGVLVGAQAVVHGAAWLTSPSSSLAPGAAGVPLPSHAAHQHADLDARMLLGHLVAAVLAALLLAALEGSVLGLAAAARSRRAAESFSLPSSPRPLAAVVVDVLSSADGARAWSRRGPPALHAPA